METKIQNEKPCLVETPQGFSVFYRNKFLYSKYAPARSICQTIEKLALLPGTLFYAARRFLPMAFQNSFQNLTIPASACFVNSTASWMLFHGSVQTFLK